MDEEASKKLQELQILERNLQSFMAQKQAFQLELTETTNALGEIKNTSSDIFKLTGQIMIKANKEKTVNELEEKKKLLELRISSIEKQEALLETKATELKNETKKLLESKKP